MNTQAFTAVDLFCGAGGLSAGLVRSGFKIVAALDSWAPAVSSYRLNFQHPVVQADIVRLAVADFRRMVGLTAQRVDLVVGGPPCQGFSVQRIGSDEDKRNDLVHEFGRFVLELQPRIFIMENVPGLLGRRGKSQAQRFVTDMRLGGYSVLHTVLNAMDYGVPQRRRRVFFYGWPTGRELPFSFPSPTTPPTDYRTVFQAIGDLPSPPLDFTPASGDPLHRRFRMSPTNSERLKHIPAGGGFENLPIALRVNAHKAGPGRIGHRNVYGRLAPHEPSSTITARFDSFTRGKFAHPFDDRNITLREGARLQTFPDQHQFIGSQEEVAALIGNAVPVLLAESIGHALFRHLHGASSHSRDETPQQQLDLYAEGFPS